MEGGVGGSSPWRPTRKRFFEGRVFCLPQAIFLPRILLVRWASPIFHLKKGLRIGTFIQVKKQYNSIPMQRHEYNVGR